MAVLHDFLCPKCGWRANDVVCPVRASLVTVECRVCRTPLEWIPQVGSMSLIAESQRETIQILQPDGSHKPVVVSSVGDIRRLERESEVAYANGEGEKLVWRSYSQDKSNGDKSPFPDPSQRPDPAFVKRGVVKRATEAEAQAISDYGPGVSDANTSPIGE